MVEDREVEELTGVYEELDDEGKERIAKSAGILLTGQKLLKEDEEVKDCQV